MTSTVNNRKWIIKKSMQTEQLLNRYYTIVSRDFCESDDFTCAQQILDQLASVFKHVSRKEDVDMLKLIEVQRALIEELQAI